jgi:hypothetical protein
VVHTAAGDGGIVFLIAYRVAESPSLLAKEDKGIEDSAVAFERGADARMEVNHPKVVDLPSAAIGDYLLRKDGRAEIQATLEKCLKLVFEHSFVEIPMCRSSGEANAITDSRHEIRLVPMIELLPE